MNSYRDPAIEGMRTPLTSFISRVGRLPLSIIEGISNAIGNAAPTMQDPQNFQHDDHQPLVVPAEFLFLSSFERQYGDSHPFFYATRFTEALKIARDESKFMFIYLHDPEHSSTPPFCHGTLCSSLVVEFLDANLVSWGAISDRGEGLKMAMALKAETFPFFAIAAPASGDGDIISILRKVEGPVSPEELVEILQSTIEEQGSAFRCRRAQEEDQLHSNRRLREEQDAAYQASLERDKIRIRFPNGTKTDKSLLSTDTIQSIYKYVDSLDLPGVGGYRLISNFPRKVYGHDQLQIFLKDAGLLPTATLYLELFQ